MKGLRYLNPRKKGRKREEEKSANRRGEAWFGTYILSQLGGKRGLGEFKKKPGVIQ